MKLQSLNAFVTEESLRLAAFSQWWRMQNASDPQAFPMDVEPGLWDEMFHTFDPAIVEQKATNEGRSP